jgi:transcriptional regulator with XRE-family HTH domain
LVATLHGYPIVNARGIRTHDLHSDNHAVSPKGLGDAITAIRERCGIASEELVPKSGLTLQELNGIEGGEIDALWGDLRKIARGLGMPLAELLSQVEEYATGSAGEKSMHRSKEPDPCRTDSWPPSDAAEGN